MYRHILLLCDSEKGIGYVRPHEFFLDCSKRLTYDMGSYEACHICDE